MGAAVGRHQPRAAEDIVVRLLHILRSRVRSIVFPGRRESDLNEELQLHLERETERLQATAVSREEARTPADIGNAVTLLCSHEAAWITGQLIAVDGGMGLMDPGLPLAIQQPELQAV
jgi:hypothetical protein